jgi:NAD(P)-dependent dehydrogenase (short-subunit alcohol dehydrogenase family)
MRNMAKSFEGKRIAVTGVSSGIGAAAASLLNTRGAKIVGFDRNPPKSFVDEFHLVDLADPDSIMAALPAQNLRLDALCNVAGVPPTADKATVLKVNFFGMRAFTEGAVGHLADGAPIVNLASLAGFQWRSNITQVREGLETSFENADSWIARQAVDSAFSYYLSKELVIAWSVWNCQRWKDRGIRINCVSPGPVSTPILSDFVNTLGKRAEDDLKINRPANVDEIAPIVAFLCSDEARWINGADIAADAGAGANAWREMLS